MKTTRIVIAVITMGVMLSIGNSAFSHPHVFITSAVSVDFDDKGLAGFKIKWAFDEMFTSMILNDYDKNKNNKLEKNEVAAIKKEAFSYIANFNYFSFVKIDGKAFDVKSVESFNAAVENNMLVYIFYIPCQITATKNVKKVSLASYDPSYYAAIMFGDSGAVSVKNAETFSVKTAVKEDKSTAIYYDQVHPWTLFLDFNNKS